MQLKDLSYISLDIIPDDRISPEHGLLPDAVRQFKAENDLMFEDDYRERFADEMASEAADQDPPDRRG